MSTETVPKVIFILLLGFHGACTDCNIVSSKYFQWLSNDGFLLSNTSLGGGFKEEWNCSSQWEYLNHSPSCMFCSSSAVLVCGGKDPYRPPVYSSLPTTNISLIKLTGSGLTSLQSKCFENLTIGELIIEDSNLTYFSPDSFMGIKSIGSLQLRNNVMIGSIHNAENLFKGLKGLKSLALEYCGLKVISSSSSAGLSNLHYVSFAGNPLHRFDIFFLQDSGLNTLNLSSVQFKAKPADIKESGLSALPRTLRTLDFSFAEVTFKSLVTFMKLLNDKQVTTINLSYLKSKGLILTSVLPLKNTLRYLSLMGVALNDNFYKERKVLNASGPFVNLEELNMYNCSLADIEPELFYAFPSLKSLSIAKNQFVYLKLEMFKNLPNLSYLSYGQNYIADVRSNNFSIASRKLKSLDFSGVNIALDKSLSKLLFNSLQNVEELSLCGATFNTDQVLAMQNLKKIKVLDLSNTVSIVPALENVYGELLNNNNQSLKELYFTKNMLKSTSNYINMFGKLLNLEILDLSNNLLRKVAPDMFGPSIKVVKLSQNLITTWYSSFINPKIGLKNVDLSNNQITYISNPMIDDFSKLNSVDLSNNPLICHSKVVGWVCENIINNSTSNSTVIKWQQRQCYDVTTNGNRKFLQPLDCYQYFKEVSTTPGSIALASSSTHSLNWLYILSIILLGSFAIFVYKKLWRIRWKIKCFIHRLLSLRKARLLRENGNLKKRPDVHYDVFVSYSDVDRSWILDHLVPNMEGDGGDISLCFHERDFKVGMSILENIIECMDRSNVLLLIVSSAFVRSKWCQFEMHLAQYRLIETFRDHLVLVLLEDLPRKERPQTLHHMMRTKTYLVWPEENSNDDVVQLFWKRLKRALKANQPYQPGVFND